MITNLFMPQGQLEVLAAQGRIERFQYQGCEIIIKNNTDFAELFFTTDKQGDLKKTLSVIREKLRKDIVVDLVSRELQMQPIADMMAENGFSQYAIFKRMARIGSAAVHTHAYHCDICSAVPGDGRTIWELLNDNFDKFSEHLPDLGEIVQAIKKGNILVARQQQKIAGLLFFSQTGYTALLRYWLVDKAFRGMYVGAGLMTAYQAMCPDAKRFILWINSKNEAAIIRYRHYGYELDGMTDIIMIAREKNGRDIQNIE